MRTLMVLVALTLPLVACDRTDPAKVAAERRAKAQAAMEECKKRVGLQDVATPTTVVLDDPASHGQELTAQLAGQLRLKVQCRAELDELLAAGGP
ncbi:MAG TPA: hypothetical protein VFL90_21990 [Methylomirabilota bacterium]|nr:hypothetical protein [Methylomirabilota bacterium]